MNYAIEKQSLIFRLFRAASGLRRKNALIEKIWLLLAVPCLMAYANWPVGCLVPVSNYSTGSGVSGMVDAIQAA